jgi:hypothetical protein
LPGLLLCRLGVDAAQAASKLGDHAQLLAEATGNR